jgi:hypothetical protein
LNDAPANSDSTNKNTHLVNKQGYSQIFSFLYETQVVIEAISEGWCPSMSTGNLERMTLIIDSMDADSDGFVSLEEWDTFIQVSRPNYSVEQSHREFKRYDVSREL